MKMMLKRVWKVRYKIAAAKIHPKTIKRVGVNWPPMKIFPTLSGIDSQNQIPTNN